MPLNDFFGWQSRENLPAVFIWALLEWLSSNDDSCLDGWTAFNDSKGNSAFSASQSEFRYAHINSGRTAKISFGI